MEISLCVLNGRFIKSINRFSWKNIGKSLPCSYWVSDDDDDDDDDKNNDLKSMLLGILSLVSAKTGHWIKIQTALRGKNVV